mmetsp:Transcript_64198/g.71723  ORF Transcript_64198/g.71723 Transcript_64198/m.71723 type:complete len:110 (+) Transcript_64198:1477-1806(+)
MMGTLVLLLQLVLLRVRHPGAIPRGTAMAPFSLKKREPTRPYPPTTSDVASTSKAPLQRNDVTVVVVGSSCTAVCVLLFENTEKLSVDTKAPTNSSSKLTRKVFIDPLW